jgi:hypothetical protein
MLPVAAAAAWLLPSSGLTSQLPLPCFPGQPIQPITTCQHAHHAGYALFGSETDGDVLNNLTGRFVSTLVPPAAAHALVYGIAVAFSGNLLVNFVLKVQ